MPRSRRALLETAGLALGSAVLAGCTSSPSLPRAGSVSPTDEPTPTDEPSPTDDPATGDSAPLESWLPNPANSPLRDGYGVRLFDLAGIRGRQDALHENSYERLSQEMLWPVPRYVDPADVEAGAALDDVHIVVGSFDPDAIAEQLTSREGDSGSGETPTRTPWSEPERYEGFDLYGDDAVYALSEDAVVYASPMGRDGDATAYAKAAIDARGSDDHYTDGNEYVAAMFEAVDAPHALWCYPEAMDGDMSRGFREDSITGGLKSWRFGAETTTLTYANTYPDAETATAGKLEEYIAANDDRFGPYDGLDVESEGLLVWTDGTIPTDEFDYLSSGGPGNGVNTPN